MSNVPWGINMRILCLFGQAKESYEGEYAPELICAVDEFVLENNPPIWDKIKKDALAGDYEKNFISLREIEISVDGDEIRNMLLKTPTLKGIVRG